MVFFNEETEGGKNGYGKDILTQPIDE